MSPYPIRPLIEQSGGAVVRLASAEAPQVRKTRDKHGRGWIGLTANREYLVTGVEQIPLLPAILVLALVIGASLYAWYREGR